MAHNVTANPIPIQTSTLREWIKLRIEAKRLSLRDLSRATGADRATLSRYLNERTDLRSETLVLILKALGVDLALELSCGVLGSPKQNNKSQGDHEPLTPVESLLKEALKILPPTYGRVLIKTFSEVLCCAPLSPQSRGKSDKIARELERLSQTLALKESTL